ncbi:ParB N-terminal domain-containing protein [Micromonospora sp. STR1_7]|uniref:ParB N-terminal domain-containing protein n=1 Tax=Micromonospora parastrephiae TaxID=2806101 RepID=A0ABS1Y2D2_9ACTN|nr:ParB N-terminal domain-containing protein [Micromonospora parastrephiae]MBM0235671.1 ParB N-terminal domain-containing protein [Micromonospora parastrephiae]
MRTEPAELSDVITHPANPRKVLGDLGDLEASIREVGVIQPPVVLPADRVAAAWPKHAEEIAGAKWVVLVAPVDVPQPAGSTGMTRRPR